MLQIKEIKKEYKTGDLVQTALNSVSLNLRDNEFVAILGPSGSGKTTLLNIIGGLDRYDSGDLIINNVSTKKYKDRDWDSYRNHTIGFVFQSYNLIPHQSVLANVELALTISGVSRAEKRRRAKEALEKVGLGDQLHKRPNQMSGGQMQRVAIARALVNDPDILLADEPTGALDTQTSIQVMDLLKEVAKDRLVVMVTHNPELAQEYATRIVQLRDGRIIGDSDPFELSDSEGEEAVHKNLGRASMSFFTALSLSFNNLWTKRGRTFLTAFAGSIGIIGIALILSLSNGVDSYIKNIEEDTLSEYPLMIDSSGMDFSGLFAQMEQNSSGSDQGEESDVQVRERKVASGMFSGIKNNDLKALKAYFDENSQKIDSLTSAIEYTYSVTPQIYRLDPDKGYRQIHPDQTLNSMGISAGGFSNYMMSGDIFTALPEKDDLYKSQYEIKLGRWPEKYNELVLVLPRSGSISDTTLYSLGLKDAKELDEMIEKYSRGENFEISSPVETFKYEDFLGLTFKLVDISKLYEYDETYGVYVDRSENREFMKKLVEDSEPITVVGIVKPAENARASMLTFGLCYHHDLIEYTMDQAINGEILKAQLADPSVDVFTGKEFGAKKEEDDFDLSKIISIDESKMAGAFSVNSNAINIDLSNLNFDLSEMDLSDLSEIDYQGIAQEYAANGELTPEQQKDLERVGERIREEVQKQIAQATRSLTNQLAWQMRNAISFNPKVFEEAIQINFSPEELNELMMASMKTNSSYEGNLRKLNYASEDTPSSVLIYPKDFESKGELTAMLDSYNKAAEEAGEKDRVITYTDYVATLMSSVTTIVNTISYVLVAFVAISLVVSSIMIGIITYISVLERTKEIGILRAIGASKRNVAQVFNAETFIVGLLAGALGVAIAALILIPGNALIHSLTGNPNVSAVLPLAAAAALVVISVILTLIGGLIPSRKAAKKDPVTALRTE